MNAAVKQGTAATAVFGKPDERELRDRMKQELPADTFKAQTWRVIWFLPLQAVIAIQQMELDPSEQSLSGG